MKTRFLYLFLATVLFAWSVRAGNAPVLEVTVSGIQKPAGEVGVAVFSGPTGFPSHLEHSYEVEWTRLESGMSTVTATFESLPPGDYAVSVLHDENGNRQLERSGLGFPKEGVAFSNDQKVKLSAPKFKKCQFPLAAGEHKKIAVQLEYRD